MTSSSRHAAATWVAMAAGIAALSLALHTASFTDAPLDRDEGAYAFIAQQWAHGAMPYGDVFDHKPPLVYVAYRVALWFGGAHLAAVRVLFAVITALTAVLCGAIVTRPGRGDRFLPPAAAAVAACVFLSSALVQGETANTETLMVLASAGAAWLVQDAGRRRAWLAGVCAGGAVMAKPVALCEAAWFGAWLLADAPRQRAATLAAFVVGLCTLPAAWVLYALARAGFGASWDALVRYNVEYGGAALPLWARAAAIPIEYGVPFALLWAGLAGCTLTTLRRPPRAANFALGWTAAAVLGTLAGGRVYGHYYQQLVPPLAVALGVTLQALTDRARWRRAALLCGVGIGLYPPLYATWQFATSAEAHEDWQPRLASVLRDVTVPADALLVWGAEPYLYFAAQRQPPTRFIYKYPLLGTHPRAAAAREDLFATWRACPAKVLVAIKRDASPEGDRTSAAEIADPGSPFHQLADGLAVVLDTGDFTVYAPSPRTMPLWHERWAHAGAAPGGGRGAATTRSR